MTEMRIFEFELIGASNTTERVSEQMDALSQKIGAPHRILSLYTGPAKSSRGVSGTRYTVSVEVLG